MTLHVYLEAKPCKSSWNQWSRSIPIQWSLLVASCHNLLRPWRSKLGICFLATCISLQLICKWACPFHSCQFCLGKLQCWKTAHACSMPPVCCVCPAMTAICVMPCPGCVRSMSTWLLCHRGCLHTRISWTRPGYEVASRDTSHFSTKFWWHRHCHVLLKLRPNQP